MSALLKASWMRSAWAWPLTVASTRYTVSRRRPEPTDRTQEEWAMSTCSDLTRLSCTAEESAGALLPLHRYPAALKLALIHSWLHNRDGNIDTWMPSTEDFRYRVPLSMGSRSAGRDQEGDR